MNNVGIFYKVWTEFEFQFLDHWMCCTLNWVWTKFEFWIKFEQSLNFSKEFELRMNFKLWRMNNVWIKYEYGIFNSLGPEQTMNKVWIFGNEFEQCMNNVWIFFIEFEQCMNNVWIWTLFEHTMNRVWTEFEQSLNFVFKHCSSPHSPGAPKLVALYRTHPISFDKFRA